MTRIAIIGAGNVGAALGGAWARAGHSVVYGVRQPEAADVAAVVAATGHGAEARGIGDAVADADVVLLAVPSGAQADAVAAAGPLDGKVLVDATNPILPGLAGLSVGHTSSGAEQLAALAPGARVVKAFNTTGAENMAHQPASAFATGPITMFLCGDDAAAKATVAGLVRDAGMDPVDVGPLVRARLLEPLAMLWITLAYAQGLGRAFALTVVRR